MRTLVFILFIVGILIVGGLVMNTVRSNNGDTASLVGAQAQTSNPEGNAAAVTPEKGALFFIFVNIVLGSVIGFGGTLALIFWFLNKQNVRAVKTENKGFSFSLNATNPNSIGGLIAQRPAVTISLVVVLIVAAGVLAALAFNVFG